MAATCNKRIVKGENKVKMQLTKEDIRRMVRNGEKIPFDFVLVGENQKQHPSIDEIKQHLSLEKPHLIPKMPREELAAWVQIYFFNNRLNNEESVIDHIMRKEIAFQAIQVIVDGAAPKGVTVKNERDWIHYFQLENQNL